MQFYDQARPDEATVRAYLRNRLQGVRAEAVEAYCLAHPDFSQRVEMDVYLTQGLRHLRESGTMERARPMRRMTLAVAAGVTAVIACGLLLLLRAHPLPLSAYRSVTEVPAALLSGPRVAITLVSLRERSGEHRVVVPDGTGVLMVRVMPDSPAGVAGYAIGIALQAAVIARSVTIDGLKPDNDGFLQLYLPVAAVVGHTLRVTVASTQSPGSPPLEFRLRITHSANPSDESH